MTNVYKTLNGRMYHRTGTVYTSKRDASKAAANYRKKGHLARVMLAKGLPERPKSLKQYQVWITLTENRW